MCDKQVTLSEKVVSRINNLQTGGAELCISTVRRALDCVVYADEYDTPETRLILVRELMYMQEIFETFIPNQKKGE